MFLIPFDIDLKFLHIRSGFFCFYDFVFVSSFLIFASQRSEEPQTGTVPSSILFRHNNIYMSAALGSQYGDTTVAAESLIAQLNSQGKLTSPIRENRKIRHEIEILKEKEPAPYMK
jgi:tRNA A37 threonylcarbamoyladenosine modification protein TsaB